MKRSNLLLSPLVGILSSIQQLLVPDKKWEVRVKALLVFQTPELPQLCPYISICYFPQCMSLTMSLPAVSPDREGGDSISGDPGWGGCDLHLDTPCTLLVVALQCCAVQRRLDGITHLRARTSTRPQILLLQRSLTEGLPRGTGLNLWQVRNWPNLFYSMLPGGNPVTLLQLLLLIFPFITIDCI